MSQRFAVAEEKPGELGVAGNSLKHLRGHGPGAGDLAAPGGIVAGEDADVGHHDDLGLGPPAGAAASLVVGAGCEQVQGVGPELIPRPAALAIAGAVAVGQAAASGCGVAGAGCLLVLAAEFFDSVLKAVADASAGLGVQQAVEAHHAVLLLPGLEIPATALVQVVLMTVVRLVALGPGASLAGELVRGQFFGHRQQVSRGVHRLGVGAPGRVGQAFGVGQRHFPGVNRGAQRGHLIQNLGGTEAAAGLRF